MTDEIEELAKESVTENSDAQREDSEVFGEDAYETISVVMRENDAGVFVDIIDNGPVLVTSCLALFQSIKEKQPATFEQLKFYFNDAEAQERVAETLPMVDISSEEIEPSKEESNDTNA